MKCSNETLIYFRYNKTKVLQFFFGFHFVHLYIFPYECRGLCWSIVLENFIEQKPHNYGEWVTDFNSVKNL